MTTVTFITRIKPGRWIGIPPLMRKRLGLSVGSTVNFRLTGDGRIEVTKATTSLERRIKRLRERSRSRVK